MQAVTDVAAGAGVVLDVRRDDEWESAHAKAAVHWPLARLEAGEIPDIPIGTKIYVYCAAGRRAEQARQILLSHGYTDVTNIGGLADWQQAGGDVQ